MDGDRNSAPKAGPQGIGGSLKEVRNRNSLDVARPKGRTSLDVVRRISSEVQRAMNPAREEANNYAGLAQAVSRLSSDVSRVSLDAKRPARTSSGFMSSGPGDTGKAPPETILDDEEEPFVPSHGITSAEADQLLEQWGRNELVEKKKAVWEIIFELVIPNLPDFALFSPSCMWFAGL